MKLSLLIAAVLTQVLCIAQDSVVSGLQYSIESEVLKEQRTFTVSLPQSYQDKKYTQVSYPVFYVLDGETSFDYMNSIVKFLSKGVYAYIPEMIVVAIHNTNRTRDLTPTPSSVPSPDNAAQVLFKGSGGNEAFTRFISSELIPHVDRHYRTQPFRVLAGHSFGGLAVTNVLLHHPLLFNAYIVHDPSYWWDQEYMLKELRRILPTTHFKNRRLFVSQATNEQKGVFDAHFEDIKIFKKIVDSVQNKSLSFQYRFYETEDHGTIPLPATFDGLRYIFEGFWMDFKKIKETPQLLTDHYKRFSEKMHYPFYPGEPKVDFILKYFTQQNNTAAAAAVLNQYRLLYPDSAPVKR